MKKDNAICLMKFTIFYPRLRTFNEIRIFLSAHLTKFSNFFLIYWRNRFFSLSIGNIRNLFQWPNEKSCYLFPRFFDEIRKIFTWSFIEIREFSPQPIDKICDYFARSFHEIRNFFGQPIIENYDFFQRLTEGKLYIFFWDNGRDLWYFSIII